MNKYITSSGCQTVLVWVQISRPDFFLSETKHAKLPSMQTAIRLKIGPRCEKTCLLGFQQSEFQTSLLSYRD